MVAVDCFRLVDSQPGKALVEVVLHEGRNHIVRRMLEAVGHPVLAAGAHRGRPDPAGRAAVGQGARR